MATENEFVLVAHCTEYDLVMGRFKDKVEADDAWQKHISYILTIGTVVEKKHAKKLLNHVWRKRR
jgi:hypothetical protein